MIIRSKPKTYSILLIVSILLSSVALFLVLKFLDPYSSALNILLFYLVLFVLSLSTFALTAFRVRASWGQREFAGQYFAISFRQAIWFAIIIVISLVLQAVGLLSMTSAIALILSFVFLEAYFLYKN